MRILNKPHQYFLDSSYIVALLDEDDVHHMRAVQIVEILRGEGVQVFISDILINEVLSVLAKRCQTKKREGRFPALVSKFQDLIQHYPILQLYELINQFHGALISSMTRCEGILSFHDCLILFFLKEIPKIHLVTFDKGFQKVKGLKVVS